MKWGIHFAGPEPGLSSNILRVLMFFYPLVGPGLSTNEAGNPNSPSTFEGACTRVLFLSPFVRSSTKSLLLA